MLLNDINLKTVEFFKKYGTKYACMGMAAGIIATPFATDRIDEHVAQSLNDQTTTRQEQVVSSNESLALMSDKEFANYANININEEQDQATKTVEETVSQKITEELAKLVEDGSIKIKTGDKEYGVSFKSFKAWRGENDYSPLDLEDVFKEVLKDTDPDERQNITFTIATPWFKTENYRVTPPTPEGPKKVENPPDIREYQRVTYDITPNKTINWDYFEDSNGELQYLKIVKYFLEGDKEKIFDIVGQSEVIKVTEQEEKGLNISEYKIKINDMDLEITLISKKPITAGEIIPEAAAMLAVAAFCFFVYLNDRRSRH